jgi:hypothetical protein
MARPPIGTEHLQHVRGAQLRQVVPEQHDLWLSHLGEAHGRNAVRGLLDAETRIVEHCR